MRLLIAKVSVGSMVKYNRLSLEEREEISLMLVQGLSLRRIAHELNRHPSTICREVYIAFSNRLTYRAVRAHRRAQRKARKRKFGKRRLLYETKLRNTVYAKLKLRWSPEQIAQWLKNEYPSDPKMQISPETIYSYLYVLPRGQLKKELLRSLRQGHIYRRYKRERVKSAKLGHLEDMISIEERPASVANRSIPGHWEGDLIIGRGRQSVMGTLVERTTRTVLLVPLKTRKAEEVRKTFAKEIKKLPQQMRLTLTYDQGKEMAQHKLFAKQTKMKVYFAHPASPWERGTNENTNGLIRQFFPKGTDLNKVSRREIKRVQHLLNGRPRKVLGWRTPYEAMQQLLQ